MINHPQKLKSLRNYTLELDFHKPTDDAVSRRMLAIAQREGLSVNEVRPWLCACFGNGFAAVRCLKHSALIVRICIGSGRREPVFLRPRAVLLAPTPLHNAALHADQETKSGVATFRPLGIAVTSKSHRPDSYHTSIPLPFTFHPFFFSFLSTGGAEGAGALFQR